MTVTLSPHTGALLQEQSGRFGQDTDALADALLQQALEEAARDYEETCQEIAEGFADIEAGRTVPFEEVRARWEAQKAERANLSKRTDLLADALLPQTGSGASGVQRQGKGNG